MKWEHAEKILNGTGTLKISPLGTWNDRSSFGAMVVDENEGLVPQYLDAKRVTSENFGKTPNFVKGLFPGWENSKNCLIDNCRIGHTHDVRHFFAFCVSQEYSIKTLRRWHKSEGYDCCIRIHNGYEFFSSLDETFQSIRPSYFIRAAITESYKDVLSDDFLLPPCFYKQTKYDDLKEVRAVWYPKQVEPQEPIYIPADQLINYFSLVDRVIDPN